MDSEQKDRTQVIIESLITTLGNREQKINELEKENVAWKTRAEIAERKVSLLIERVNKLEKLLQR